VIGAWIAIGLLGRGNGINTGLGATTRGPSGKRPAVRVGEDTGDGHAGFGRCTGSRCIKPLHGSQLLGHRRAYPAASPALGGREGL
jgi:hypothetical protein